MPVFGKTAAQHQVDREASSDDIWIKGFQEGTTKLRILDEPDAMITVRMHYDETHKLGFPCTETSSECVGCQSDSAKTRDRNRQYMFNALDSNGRLGLYRIGGRLWRTLQGRQQRSPNNTICDRDLEIIRTGKSMSDTTYDIEPGERYEIDMSEVGDKYDIQQVLAEKYEAAVAAFTGVDKEEVEGEGEKTQPAAQPAAQQSNGRIKPSGSKAADERNKGLVGKAAETPQEDEAPWDNAGGEDTPANAPDETDEGQQEATDSAAWMHEDPADMSTADIRAFLDKAEIEYPKTAVRSKLVKLAKTWQSQHLTTAS